VPAPCRDPWSSSAADASFPACVTAASELSKPIATTASAMRTSRR
jgi:hypothetical protein